MLVPRPRACFVMVLRRFLMSLAEAGKTDLAYNSIATETYPSYGYMLNNNFTNATTIWESWPFSDNTFSHDHPVSCLGVCCIPPGCIILISTKFCSARLIGSS